MHHHFGSAFPVLLAAVLLAGCSCDGPAASRGFFCGAGTMISGADERQAGGLEASAATQERQALEQRLRTREAQRQAAASSAQVRSAQARLAALQRHLAEQRAQ